MISRRALAQGYADDGVILICGKFSPLSVMSCKMQHMILGIEKWCRDKELSVNTSKTEMVLVTRRNKAEQLKTLRLPSTTVIN